MGEGLTDGNNKFKQGRVMQQEKLNSNYTSTQQKSLNYKTLLLFFILAEKINSYLLLSFKIITANFLEEKR